MSSAAAGPGKAYVAVYHAVSDDPWPYDYGDDPAFEASQVTGGPLSWGICRKDLRQAVQPGDLVVFVGSEKLSERNPAPYRLTAWATVAKSVRQTEVWTEADLSIFRTYRNLLLRPATNPGSYEYYENLPAKYRHEQDWMWLISPPGRHPKKDQYTAAVAQGQRQLLDGLLIVGANKLRPGSNYVIFDQLHTRVMADPPLLAHAHSPSAAETWVNTPLAVAVRKLLLDSNGGKRTLRVPDQQFAHRHVALNGTAQQLRHQLDDISATHGLISL